MTIDGDIDGLPIEERLPIDFGPDVSEDSYDNPFVMACCPQRDYAAPNCGQGHERACITDFVDQGCKSIETNLRDFAEDEFGGPGGGNGIKRIAINKIADYTRDNRSDCVDSFLTNPGILSTSPMCDEDDNGVPYLEMLQEGQWSFDPNGLVDRVTIEVSSAVWTGLRPEEGTSPDECESADDNDHVQFLEIDPDPTSMFFVMTIGDADLEGPVLDGETIHGSAELASSDTECLADECSTMAVLVDSAGNATLENLELYSANSVAVGTPNESITLSSFQLLLWDATPATVDSGALMISPGSGRFAISATADGVSSVIVATNATEIVIDTTVGWSTSEFSIVYKDVLGESWTLMVGQASWE